MERDNVLRALGDLVQLDVDAVLAYEQASKDVREANIAEALDTFQDDHEQHVHDLATVIRHFGGLPPELPRLSSFTPARLGTRASLVAMRQAEAITNARYEAILATDMPLEVRDIIERNFLDEQRHLALIDRMLAERLWESGGDIVPPPQPNEHNEHA